MGKSGDIVRPDEVDIAGRIKGDCGGRVKAFAAKISRESYNRVNNKGLRSIVVSDDYRCILILFDRVLRLFGDQVVGLDQGMLTVGSELIRGRAMQIHFSVARSQG